MPVRKRVAALIVGAGQGIRMGAQEKKQYMVIANRPVLAHTLLAFENCDAISEIFLVIPPGDDLFCRAEIITPIGLGKPLQLVSGGPTRQASVYEGLKAMGGRFDLVVIHDAVRPLVKPAQILECLRMAEQYGGCTLATAATDTVKTVDEEDQVVVTMKRELIRMAQTPQAFHYSLILAAHETALQEAYAGTDDAQLVELMGDVVMVIPGDPYNIKITCPQDLLLAEALLSRR
jgi:2-C-methyl-D-erythritol 4-phosphate cytidylyltransferase